MKRVFTFLMIIHGILWMSMVPAFGQRSQMSYADRQLELSNYSEAAKAYQSAYDKKATYRAAKGAANAYDKLSAFQEAYQWWKIAVDFEEATSTDFSRYVAAIHQTGNLEELEEALEHHDLNGGNQVLNLDSLRHWYASPDNVRLVNLEKINSPSADYGIAFDNNGNTYFTSNRGPIASSARSGIRIDGSNKFDAKRDEMTGRAYFHIYKEENGEAAPLTSVVPKSYHFSDPFFMKEKPVIFYSLTRDQGKVKKQRNYSIYPEIYFSNIDQHGELLDYLPFPINSPLEYGVVTPFVDEREKKVYFASNRPGGQGGYDLYFVSYDEDMNFGSPVNLGPAINTEGDERDPFIVGDSFYFSSDGHAGLGGLDLFRAAVTSGKFTDVQNLGLPYNSPQDDFALKITDEGSLYISSNRSSGAGLDDIYKVEELYRRLVANVEDCDGNPITENLAARLVQKVDFQAVDTQQKDGSILANLAPEADFELTLSKEGFFPIRDTDLSTKGMKEEQLERDYIMKKIPYNTVVLNELIYYDYGQSKLRADATPTMEKVAELLKNFTFMEILVRSHADSRSSNAFNEALSERRANAVRDFLGNYGIARSRVKSEWFGEEQLVNDCGDGVPCPESEHQLNRRSELILIAFPDEGKTYDFPKQLENMDLSSFDELDSLIDCIK